MYVPDSDLWDTAQKMVQTACSYIYIHIQIYICTGTSVHKYLCICIYMYLIRGGFG